VVTFLPLWIANAALFYSLNALVAVLIRFGLGRWGNRVSQRWVVSLGILCSGTALMGLAIAPHLLVLWSIVYGLGFGSLFPVLSAIVSLSAPATVRGRVYSVFLAGFDGGMTLGGAGVQPLVQVLPLSTLFLLLGGVGCGVSLIALRQFAQPIAVVRE
jgi:MFS family permease